MEGDGEGVLAVVRGLEDGGVTLTVVNRRPETRERRTSRPKRIAINPIPVIHQRSSVETSTDCGATTSAGVQICDGRYASSYRMAHCRIAPTSPPERVSEFPPQRQEPCRNQGNFEVGGHGSGQLRTSSAGWRNYSESRTCCEKGSFHRTKSSRATDGFVHSLRKYPSMSPVRSVSTDLIEKLIKYTQAKNSPKTSRTTKSMRSLHKDRSADTNNVVKVSKHQQTYTRSKPNNNVANTSNMPLGYKGRTKNFKLYSPMSDNKNIKYRETPFSSSYDYLKAASSRHYERSERDIRLHDVSRYIRSTIRQIYNERPVVFQVCPKIKSRYHQHKRNSCPMKNEDTMINDEEDQASVPVLSRILASFSGCGMPSTTGSLESSKRTDTYCYCTKASQCSCKPDASTSTPVIQSKATQPLESRYCDCCPNTKNTSTQGVSICECKSEEKRPVVLCQCSLNDQAYYNKRIDEEIRDWFKDVPVHSVESPENKKKRENMVKNLGKMLKQLPDDENYEENARKEIENFMHDFPMWYPGAKKDEEQFKKELGEKLMNKIQDIPKKPDRFRDAVKKWAKDLNLQIDDENFSIGVMEDNLVNNLKALAADRPENDNTYKDLLQKEIVKMIEKLPLNNLEENKDVVLHKMANKLAADIVRIPKDVDLTKDRTNLKDEFKEDILDWLDEISAFKDGIHELKGNEKLVESLANKLNKLQSQGISDKQVIEKMKNEIHKFMADVDIAIDTLDILIDDLVAKLTNTVQTHEIDNLDEEELTDEIIDWLQGVPGFTDINPRKFTKIVEDITNIIKAVKKDGKEDYQNELLHCLKEAGINMDPYILSKHVEELLEILEIWPNNNKYKENAKKYILKEIDNVINASLVPKDKKKELKNKFTNMVGNSLDMSPLDSEESQNKAMEAILEGTDTIINETAIPKDKKTDLKNKITDVLLKHFDISFSVLKKVKSQIQQIITKDVNRIIRRSSIDPEQKTDLIRQVKGALAENMNKPLPENIKDTINEGISDIIDESAFAGDENKINVLKNMLTNTVGKVMDVLPSPIKNVGDIQDKVAKDIFNVIDKIGIGSNAKINLKQNWQNILNDNVGEILSDDVKESIKNDFFNNIDSSSIPEEKKNILKSEVGDTINKTLDKALSGLKQDLSKLKHKLAKDIKTTIEKSPLIRDEKNILKNKLKGMLSDNFDTSVSTEAKDIILKDISNIVDNASIPIDKRSNLKTKMMNTLTSQFNAIPSLKTDTESSKDKVQNEIIDLIDEMPIPMDKKNEFKNLLKTRLAKANLGGPLCDIKEDIYGIIQNMPISKEAKSAFESKLARVLVKNLSELPAESNKVDDIKDIITHDISSAIDKLPIDSSRKEEIKDRIENKLAEILYQPLSEEVKDNTKQDVFNIIDEVTPKNKKSGIKEKLQNMLRINLEELPKQGKGIGYVKNAIIMDVSKIIDELNISKDKKKEVLHKLNFSLSQNMDRILTDSIKESIEKEINDILDDSSIPEDMKSNLKNTLAVIVGKSFEMLPGKDKGNIKDIMSQDIAEVIDRIEIDKNKKDKLKRKVNLRLAESLFIPLTEEVKNNVKSDISKILDEINLPANQKKDIQSKIAKTLAEDIEVLQTLGKDVGEIKKVITENIKNIIVDSQIPEDDKNYLKQQVQDTLNENLLRPISDELKETIQERLADIIDESTISKDKKSDLKKELENIVAKNLDELQNITKETEIKDNIMREIDSAIEKSHISEEKKRELKHKLKKMAAENFSKPLSDDVRNTIKDSINDILEEIPLTKAEKNTLKNKLDEIVDENIVSLLDSKKEKEATIKLKKKRKSVTESQVKHKILQEIEDSIEGTSIPIEKKLELNNKLKKMAAGIFEKPLTAETQNLINDGINNILDDLPLSEDKKNKLKAVLTGIVSKNIESLRGNIEEEDSDSGLQRTINQSQIKHDILHEIESTIEQSSIPQEKKAELKNKLKAMVTENLKKPFSEDAQNTIKDGINDILDELPLSKDKKKLLKSQLTGIVDKNLKSLHSDVKEKYNEKIDLLQIQTKDKILEGIEKAIDQSPISKEEKVELKKQLKQMATETFKGPLSDDTQDAIKDGITNILDKLPLSQHKKDKLKSDLADVVDKNMESLREDTNKVIAKIHKKTEALESEDKNQKRSFLPKKVNESEVKDNILQEMEKTVEQLPISKEKKLALKKKFTEMATEMFNKPLSDNMQSMFNDGISNILDELPLSQNEKTKLKNKLTNVVDKNIESLHESKKYTAMETRTKDMILKGIEKTIDQSSVSKDTKIKLKKQLKEMATENFKGPLCDNAHNAIKDGISNILDELPIPEDEKIKLKNELAEMVDDNIESLREDIEEKYIIKLDTRTQNNILKGIEETIKQSSIPEEKKIELKTKIIEMASENFNKPLSDDVQNKIKDGINQILDMLPLSEDNKDKLKNQLADVVDENIESLQENIKEKHAIHSDELATRAQDNILKGIEKTIAQSEIPEEKKRKLKKKVKEMTAENLKKPLSNDVQAAIKDGMSNILEEMELPKGKKDKLENELTDVIDNNINSMSNEIREKRIEHLGEMKHDTRHGILQGIKKNIAQSPIQENKKQELKNKLKEVTAKNLKKPLSEDVQDSIKDGIGNILDEMHLPKDQKHELKNELTHIVDKNIDSFRDDIKLAKQDMNKFQKREERIAEVNKSLREELEDVLGEHHVDMSDILSLEKDLINDLEDLVVRGGDPKSAKNKIKQKIMQDLNWSDDQADSLADTIIGRAKEMSLIAKTTSSDVFHKARLKSAGPKRRIAELSDKEFLESPEMLKVGDKNIYLFNGVEYDIDDNEDARQALIETSVIASSHIAAQKPSILKKQLKEKMSKVISDAIDPANIPNKLKSSLKSKLLNRIEENMDKSPLEQKKDTIKLKDAILKDAKEIIDESSIPADIKKSIKFQLDRDINKDFDDMNEIFDTLPDTPKSKKDFIPGHASTPKKLANASTGTEYSDQIMDLVRSWIDDLPAKLDPKQKHQIIRDIACDIMERQKYLQVKPGPKTSHDEELANLKYQVYRRLSKLLDRDDMTAVIQETEKLLDKIKDVEVPLNIPKLRSSSQQEVEHARKRKNEAVPHKSKKSTATPTSSQNIKGLLIEEISDVLDTQNIVVPDRNKLEADILVALEELSKKGGDTSTANHMVRKSITKSTNLPQFQVDKLSDKLVDIAREMSLISKTKDSNVHHLVRLNKSEDPKRRYTDTTDKDVIHSPETIKIERKGKTGPEQSTLSGFAYNADDDKDTNSLKIDVINVPKDPIPSIIKKRLKDVLYKDIDAVIQNTSLLKTKKKQLKQQLNNIIEKDLDKLSLSQKQDIHDIKQTMLNDMNNLLDRALIPKDKINELKYKVGKVLNKDLDESLLTTTNIAKERLSRNLDEVIGKLPISLNEKSDLKEKLTNMMSDTTEQTDKTNTKMTDNGNFSIALPTIEFVPTHHSTPKKDKETNTKQDLSGLKTDTMYSQDNTLSDTNTQSYDKESQISSENAETEYTEQIRNIVKAWVNKAEMGVGYKVMNKLIKDLTCYVVDKKKYLQISSRAKPTIDEELETLKYEIYRRMNKLVEIDKLTPVMHETEELLANVMKVDVPLMIVPIGFHPREDSDQPREDSDQPREDSDQPREDSDQPREDSDQPREDSDTEVKKLGSDITENVIDWIDSLPINITNDDEKKLFEKSKKDFIAVLKNLAPKGDVQQLKTEIAKFIKKIPIDPDMKENDELVNQKVAELVDNLSFIPTMVAKERRYGMSFNGLSDFIGDWIDNIQIDDDTKDENEIREMKKNIALNLINKIGEMNVDPVIFNDTSLYENVLRDEVNNLLEDLPITVDDIHSLKEDLIKTAKEAQIRAHDEKAGRIYKNNLLDTMPKVFPDLSNLSTEEQVSLNILKDQLADAFINLHYAGSNEDLANKIKKKIASEINQFCEDYLQRHPCYPIDSKQLNQDLYNALKQVPLPAQGSIRYEVEQIRIRDEINDWVRELPLEHQTPAELMVRNKMIYVLSKKLFDIEAEMEESNIVPAMRKEIIKWLKKMPLKPGEDKNMGEFAENLIKKLKDTEMSRRFSESAIKGTGVGDDDICPYYKSLLERQNLPPCKKQKQRGPSYPPCTLSPEDMAHLERIRQRNCLAPKCLSSVLKGKRNAGVGPRHIFDAGSQTELNKPGTLPPRKPYQQSPAYPSMSRQTATQCPGIPVIQSNQSGYQDRRSSTPAPPTPCSVSDSRGEIQPHIIIKEYYWDSTDSSKLQESVSQQPSTGPHQISTSPQLQQTYSPQKLPCDRVFPYPNCKPQRPPPCPQQKSYQMPQNRSSHGSLPCSRRPYTPSPCTSPFKHTCAPPQQSSPLNSSGVSSRYNECRMPKRDGLQDQNTCSSRPCRKERVIELGSLDDLREPRPKKRQDTFDWSYANFPEEDNFWGTPCMRRVILDEGIDEPLMMEREKREERVRCKCKERLVPNCSRTRPRTCNQPSYQACNASTCQDEQGNLKRCSKCCGLHCPYPSYLYFRQ